MGLVRRDAATLLGGVAACVLLQSGSVLAQTQTNPNASNVTLLERLVIGAGAPKVAIDTPQAVTVVSQEDLDAEQATTTGDIFDSVPGVSVVGSDRAFGEAFNIRGIGQTENSADGSRIIVTVDGAPKFNELYRVGSFFSEPELYKSVEVLRGPASSTLYGSGALGGVINFTTKDASDFLDEGQTGAVRLKGQYTSNGNGTLASGIWAHQINETFEVLAAGNWRRSDEFELANGATLSGSDFDALSGLLKGTARFGDNDEQVLRLSYQRWQSNAEDQDYAQTGTSAIFGLVDRDVLDQTAVLAYENPDSDNPWVDIKAALTFSDTAVHQNDPTALSGAFADADYGYRTWTGKVENTMEFAGENFENFLTLGLQLSRQNRIADSRVGSGAINTHPEGLEEKIGIYAQDEFIWDERLTLITGARADFVWQTPSDAAAAAGAREVEDVALSPKVAALYKLNDNFGVFGSVAHTERLPTLDELYTWSKGVSLNLEKEESNNFEGGFTVSAYDLAQEGDSLNVKTTAFYNHLTNLIETTPTGWPTYYRNVGEAEIYGLEVEAAYNSEYVFGNLAYTATVGTNLITGRPLATIPAHRLVATLGARAPEHDLEYGLRGTIVADAENSVSATSTTPIVPVPGYAKLDLFASWKPQSGPFEGLEAQVGIDNVFNADYRDNLSSDRSKGRTFKLTLAKQFDY